MIIERIRKPEPHLFEECSRSFKQPIVVTGVVEGWRAFGNWSLPYLVSVVGAKTVRVAYSPDSSFRGDPTDGYLGKFRYMKFDTFARGLSGPNAARYYLAQQPLDGERFAPLRNDVENPSYIDKMNDVTTNIWLGPKGVVSPLHFDYSDNFLAQVAGGKRLTLFKPSDSDKLYSYPPESKIAHLSQVDIRDADMNKFPRFVEAEPVEVVLERGEMLFLPSGWWHHVESLSESISVNFWWK